MILFEDEKFFLIDTGSSNGSFVNNIRLSKAGEESKLTRIYTNDVLRFGSDVLDKVNLRCTYVQTQPISFHRIEDEFLTPEPEHRFCCSRAR